ncbi:MAG: hypothetical protein KJO24_02710, partial [Gammaproteobacteria bacterium]|nr:hypothetical protein [Gammaproteobacteria bacterium]
MQTESWLYGYSSVVISAILFVLIIFANELGYWLGRFVQAKTDSEIKSLTGAVQASILGLLALLLGFTFSMSMQRYDQRSLAVIDEANAIGTALLRAELLPAAYQPQAKQLLEQYVSLRISVSTIDMTRASERAIYAEKMAVLQRVLWNIAIEATRQDANAVTTGSFSTALNQLFDSQGKRNALLQMHVPEVVLILLFMVFIASGSMLGYSSGLSGKRIQVPIVLISLLITLIVFIIIDLDRPKR